MTTILWHGPSRTLACDTLVVGNNGEISHASKYMVRPDGIVAVGGFLYGLSVFDSWLDDAIKNPDREVKKFPKSLRECDCIYVSAVTDQIAMYEGVSAPSVLKFDGIYGWGTGGSAAQAFAVAGYGPVESIQMASAVDVFTGDEVEVVPLQRLYRNNS